MKNMMMSRIKCITHRISQPKKERVNRARRACSQKNIRKSNRLPK
ncbi:hypothetical protein HanHA300_Chr09g0304691 [Helianthus annuus]|nr:hypothetical protein HanHA300_Chr09g0304691 [Helianthus annuus]KAJ0541173.1 hypothetical protein HanHA89_Chr09g0325441 [Helianthus annuus]KAJ0706255.1 hypothetical protein HanLR1_Chr09g0304941 [Helianthus annuus]